MGQVGELVGSDAETLKEGTLDEGCHRKARDGIF